jgi:hypothetical protein
VFSRLSRMVESDELTYYRTIFLFSHPSDESLKSYAPASSTEKREAQQQLTTRTALKIEENVRTFHRLTYHITARKSM